MLLLGDCNEWLKEISDNSIDLIVSDPPYGIEFMGKDWDKALVHTETWKECFRVLKDGKLAFVMCSPRQDVLSRMIINLQDAGFRTNYTSIYWTYSSGFPKAANVSKLIDKKNGRTQQQYIELGQYIKNERLKQNISSREIAELFPSKTGGLTGGWWNWENSKEVPTLEQWVILKQKLHLDNRFDEFIGREEAEREIIDKTHFSGGITRYAGGKARRIEYNITKPATEAAKKMEGAYVGFQPKPAVEVILVVSKGKTLTWLDECRIPYQSEDDKQNVNNIKSFNNKVILDPNDGWNDNKIIRNFEEPNEKGRFPANLLVSDDCLNDGKITKSSPVGFKTGVGHMQKTNFEHGFRPKNYYNNKPFRSQGQYNDSGSYSRYFSLDAWADKTFPFIITPKASRSERNKGCEDLENQYGYRQNGFSSKISDTKLPRGNVHPTVKPLKLCSYLITMGSREGDLVLDPFCGSGTVCIAADQLHRKWIGIEKNEEYAAIIKKRLMVPLSQLKLSVWSGKKKDDSDGSQRIC